MTGRIHKISPKSYHVHKAINLYIVKLLQHLNEEEEIKLQADPSPDELEEMKAHKRYLDKEKVRILDEYIFPSMANLVFFFKCIASFSELRPVFENDVKDLIGVRRSNPQENNYGFVISNLLHSLLLVGEGLYLDRRVHHKDFRLRLNQLLQEIVWAKFGVSLTQVFRNSSAQHTVTDDFNKVWGWTRMLAASLDELGEDTELPRRTIEFRTDQLKEDWDKPIRPW